MVKKLLTNDFFVSYKKEYLVKNIIDSELRFGILPDERVIQ